LTLAILDVLLVGVASNTYAIPLHAVTEVVEGDVQRLRSLVGKKAIRLRGEVVPVEMLSDLLNLRARDPSSRLTVARGTCRSVTRLTLLKEC